MSLLFRYYRSAREELGKVIFPVAHQVRGAFVSVLLVVGVIALFLSVIDVSLYYFVSGILR